MENTLNGKHFEARAWGAVLFSLDDWRGEGHDRGDAFRMAEFDDRFSVALPEALRQQFAEVERRLWRAESTIAVCGAAGGLMVSFLALFVSDRLWETPDWMRWGLFFAGLGCAGAAGGSWARRWIWRRRDLKALANLVQKKYRPSGRPAAGDSGVGQRGAPFRQFFSRALSRRHPSGGGGGEKVRFPPKRQHGGGEESRLWRRGCWRRVALVFAVLPAAGLERVCALGRAGGGRRRAIRWSTLEGLPARIDRGAWRTV